MAGLGVLFIDIRPARDSPSFRSLLLSQLAATFSKQALIVIVPFQIYVLTSSPALVGLVGIAQAIPLIVFSFVGGLLADTRERRRLLAGVQLGMAIISVLFALCARWDSPVLVFALVILNGALAGMEAPTRSSIIPLLVRPALLPSAYALNNMLGKVAAIIGPAVIGVLLAEVGFVLAYCISAAALLAGATSSYAIRTGRSVPRTNAGIAWSSMAEGFKFISSRATLRQCLLVDLLATGLGMPRALFPIFGLEVLGGDASTVGLLYSALGVGALFGLLTGGWTCRTRRQGRTVIIAVSFWSLAIVGFGLSHALWLSVLCLALGGAADAISAIMRMSIVQLATPDQLRGRVSAFIMASFQTGPMLGDARAGLVAASIGPVASAVTGGIACALALASLRPRSLWRQRANPTDI